MDNKIKIAIFIALLFHISGLIGMLTVYKPWFISMTPLTLLLMFGLLWWTEQRDKNDYLFAITVFVTGLAVEIIGVNTGLLFGSYEYGDVMSIKVMGVPWLMGVQWLVTILCIAHLVKYLTHKNQWSINALIFAVIAASITTIYDVVIEPIAIDFDYWHWHSVYVPFYNYVCWFIISFVLHYVFIKLFEKKAINVFAIVLIAIQALFFILLNLF